MRVVPNTCCTIMQAEPFRGVWTIGRGLIWGPQQITGEHIAKNIHRKCIPLSESLNRNCNLEKLSSQGRLSWFKAHEPPKIKDPFKNLLLILCFISAPGVHSFPLLIMFPCANAVALFFNLLCDLCSRLGQSIIVFK